MLSIPPELKIGNRTVPVTFAADITDGQGGTIMGFYDPADPRIVLKEGMSPLATVETFWHELMHAIFDYTRFGVEMMMEMQNSENPEQDAFMLEERSAESFAKVLLQVMQDNQIAQITT